MNGYELVVWDWNGTLLDDFWLGLEVANGMLRRRGLQQMDEARYRAIFDFPVSEYYRIAGFDFDREPFPILADEFITEYNERVRECSLHAAASEILSELNSRGVRQVVLSASRQKALDEALEHYGILHHFETVQGLDDHFAVSKVSAGRDLLDGMNVDRATAVMVGDTTHDYDVARELGIESVLISAGHQSSDRLEATGAPVYSSLQAFRGAT